MMLEELLVMLEGKIAAVREAVRLGGGSILVQPIVDLVLACRKVVDVYSSKPIKPVKAPAPVEKSILERKHGK